MKFWLIGGGKCVKSGLTGSYNPFELSYAETPAISFASVATNTIVSVNFTGAWMFDGLGNDGSNLKYSIDNKVTWVKN